MDVVLVWLESRLAKWEKKLEDAEAEDDMEWLQCCSNHVHVLRDEIKVRREETT